MRATNFFEKVFGGRSLETVAVAAARSFLQDALKAPIFVGLVDVVAGGTVDVSTLQLSVLAALFAGIGGLVSTIHGFVQDPEARSTKRQIGEYFDALSAIQSAAGPNIDVTADVTIESAHEAPESAVVPTPPGAAT